MTEEVVEQVHSVVRGVLPTMAETMNIALTDAQAEILAENVTFALDEACTVRLLSEGFTSDDLRNVCEVVAKQLRNLYFLQVGVELGLRLGYTAERDGAQMQQLGEVFNIAFEEAMPDRPTEKYTLPPLQDFVVSIFAKGFEYWHIMRDDDGSTTAEWRRVWREEGAQPCNRYEVHRPESEGPAVVRTAPDGSIVLEEYVEHGRTHRVAGPAKCMFNRHTKTFQETWMQHGRLTRTGAPAFIERTPDGRVVTEMWFEDNVFCRHDGPAGIWRSYDPADDYLSEQFSTDGVTVRWFENGVEKPYA